LDSLIIHQLPVSFFPFFELAFPYLSPVVYDTLIVGFGLAGACLAHTLRKDGQKVMVLDSRDPNSASRVAAGLWNPVMMRHFKSVWKMEEQLPLARSFYKQLEKELNVVIWEQRGISRIFADEKEQQAWEIARTESAAAHYLSPPQKGPLSANVPASFGFGNVEEAGTVNVKAFLNAFGKLLEEEEVLLQAAFDFDALEVSNESVVYKSIVAKRIVFCEGAAGRSNPWFSYLPLHGKKGECLEVELPNHIQKEVLANGMFLVPQANGFFWWGGTFNHGEDDCTITEAKRKALLLKLEQITPDIPVVKSQVAGMRPNVSDKKPLVGQHVSGKPVFICNGLGSRGTLNGPYAARALSRLFSTGEPIEEEMNCARFLL